MGDPHRYAGLSRHLQCIPHEFFTVNVKNIIVVLGQDAVQTTRPSCQSDNLKSLSEAAPIIKHVDTASVTPHLFFIAPIWFAHHKVKPNFLGPQSDKIQQPGFYAARIKLAD
jgi:hypothetical protein